VCHRSHSSVNAAEAAVTRGGRKEPHSAIGSLSDLNGSAVAFILKDTGE
jgi:hypothetical protein